VWSEPSAYINIVVRPKELVGGVVPRVGGAHNDEIFSLIVLFVSLDRH
jgi:hypothetical protein